MTTITEMEQELLNRKIESVNESIRGLLSFSNNNDISNQQYNRVVRLHKDMITEKVFIYKYELCCDVIKAINRLMNATEIKFYG